jgi:HptB-dependent secretion and biofilm anti anti-sigma factor
MSIESERVGNKITIRITGVFGHECREKFQHVFTYQEGKPKDHEYIIDFKEITHISSTGAGLLILLRDHCGEESANISLINVNDHILGLLELLQFNRIFKIN